MADGLRDVAGLPARRFTAAVDSAAVLVNASTRGPMGLPEMTSTKYVVTGEGHVR